MHAVPLTAGNHQFTFLIGKYSHTHILLRKFDTLSEKEVKMMKTQIL